jgi:hypothetical protein
MFRLIRKGLLLLLAFAVAWGLVRNLIVAPASGLLGLVVLVGIGYVAWRAWPAVRHDAGRIPRGVRARLRGRHAGARGDTL